MVKIRKEDVIKYLQSRKFVFLRILIFLFLSGIAWYIGEQNKATFFYTTRFFYPLFLMAALIQIWFLLPKWSFLKSHLQKLFRKGLGTFRRFFPPIQKKKKKKRVQTYRDESFRAEGLGYFSRKQKHLRWKDMKSNNDKIRYLYMKYVLQGVKKGNPFKYCFTPKELQRLWKEEEELPLVNAYHGARYGTEELPEELVKKLGG